MPVLPALLFLLAFGIQAPSPSTPPQPASPIVEELWAAARAGDVARITSALEKGADVNAKTRYGATALLFAADKGHLEAVKLLVARGADLNAQDSFYRIRAIDMALQNEHDAVAQFLLERGSKGAGNALMRAVRSGNQALASAALASPDLTSANLRGALAAAKKENKPELAATIEKKLAEMPADAAPAVAVDRAVLESYAGTYRNENAGQSVTVALSGNSLVVTPPGGAPPLTLVPTSQSTFRLAEQEG